MTFFGDDGDDRIGGGGGGGNKGLISCPTNQGEEGGRAQSSRGSFSSGPVRSDRSCLQAPEEQQQQ